MSPKQVVAYYGDEKKAARALGRTTPAIYHWLKMGRIPFPMQCLIQHKTNGALKATG